ncbi:MAG: TonB-dependent receptor [Bacteroidota bacterium]
MRFYLILLLTSLISILELPYSLASAVPPDKSLTISGILKDELTGEALIGATVFVKELKTGTTANAYGFYSLSLKPGNYILVFSFVGYGSVEKHINLQSNITLNISLSSQEQLLKEMVVVGERVNDNIKAPEMSVVKMDAKMIKQIPAFMGEVDIIKAIQLLPGVTSTSEGGSGFSVRGGSPDQNLIQLDEATVYNASHLMGFFSVFNNDAIKDVKLYKGDLPPFAGGRIASLLDVRMKDGNNRKFEGNGGIGTISSRLTLEGPILKDKASFMISARRTYADIFLMFSNNENLRKSKLYFYDLNAKLNYTIDDNNRLYLSAYSGRDNFKNTDFLLGWGNNTFTLRWNHLFSKKLFSNFSIVNSKFNYGLGVPAGQAQSFEWKSILSDYTLKADFGYYPNPENTIRFGISSTVHHFEPGTAQGLGDSTIFTTFIIPHQTALEHAFYAGNEQNIGANLTIKYGLRASVFQNIGKGVLYHFDSAYNSTDSTVYPRGEIFNTYWGLEPRLGFTYSINEISSIKGSYSRTRQYMHLASNSTAGTPLDIWIPSSPNVKPQIADQASIGYFRNFLKGTLESSVEVYYKKNHHALDFKDHAELLLNPKLEGELRFGTADSYGIEFFLKIDRKKFSGWISYTLSRSFRHIEEINNGNLYPSNYDKPHNISVVVNYMASKRVSVGANWVFASGAPVTFPTGRAEVGNLIIPIYSDRNAYRMPAYHRLDLSVTLSPKEKINRKWYGEWNLSVYNAYARKNAWVINFQQDPENPNNTYAQMTYLFSVIPAITYNFKF